MLRVIAAVFLLGWGCQGFAAPSGGADAGGLLSAQAWVQHAEKDLLPWWRHPGALGTPVGRFPTFRCSDGSAYDASQPCEELRRAAGWIRPELGRNYVRMQARQVFAYSVGFHLTGDPQLLAWAKAGLADIRARAMDPATGSPATYYEGNQALPEVGERTAQDIAYAGIAFASVYYLTRDPAVLDDLDRLHRHLMRYYDAALGEMRWTLTGTEAGRRELVAQLDPLNAYMILITPLLQGERQQRWQADMRRLVQSIQTHYCAGDAVHCAGTLGQPKSTQPGARHNDFGHSGKSYWMLGLAAQQLHDDALATWAEGRAAALIKEAYLPESGSWGARWTADGVNENKDWWIYAELDQLTATLALKDRHYTTYLQKTWPYWMNHLVDHERYEVWSGASPSGYALTYELKQHHWKNGYHSMEHALIGYITSSALHGDAFTLYFADSVAKAPALQPYLFLAKEQGRSPAKEGVLAVRFVMGAAAEAPSAKQ